MKSRVILQETKSLIGTALWQIISKQVQVLAVRFNSQIFPSLGDQGPYLTQFGIGFSRHICQIASKSISGFKHGA